MKVTAPMGTLLDCVSRYQRLDRRHVHPETPSPTDVLCECTPKHRSNADADTPNANHNPKIEGPLFQWYRIRDDI